MKSYWIKKENITPQLIKVLHEKGYKQNQRYFDESCGNILMTSYVTRTYMFADFESACANFDPHRSWLTERECVETSDKLIELIKSEI